MGRCKHGFSLAELAAVVLIVGLLAALALPRVLGNSDQADVNACYVNKADIELKVELFYRDTGSWPVTNLSDMVPAATYEYFPEGLPVCPVDGSSYTIDSGTHLVVGHDHG